MTIGAAGQVMLDPLTIGAAGQVMPDPRAVQAMERLRPLAREANMTDADLHALVQRNWRSGGIAHGTAGAAEASATVTEDMAPHLTRRLGIEIEIAGVAGELGVYPTLRDGRVIVGKVVIGPSATFGDLVVHLYTIAMLERMFERDAGITGAHEAVAEIRKYKVMIVGRMEVMIAQLCRGDAAAVSRIENEILVMAGERLHWRRMLDEMNRSGDCKRARGLIEAKDIGKVTAEAIAAGYPELPNGYHYRRWPGGGPEGQEFQVFRADANSPEPPLQLRRRGNDWILEEIEGSGKVPRAFEAALRDDEVHHGQQDMSTGEPSMKPPTLADLDALPPGIVGEIIEGVLYTMTRPRIRHQRTTRLIGGRIGDAFDDGISGPGGWWIATEPGLEFPNTNTLEISPDVAGWRRERMPELPVNEPVRVVPDWVCEILSKNTRRDDQRQKMPFYAKIGVPHAWIVDLESRVLTAYQLEPGGDWRIIGEYSAETEARIAPFDSVPFNVASWWPPTVSSR